MELTSPPPPLVFGPITRTDIVRYQGASGDFQPIHHDEPFARAAGYDAPLVVGMLPAGVVASWATAWLGAENVRRVRLRWREQMWPGDVLTCTGQVSRTFEQDGEARVEVELTGTRQTGTGQAPTVAVLAWMEFVIPPADPSAATLRGV